MHTHDTGGAQGEQGGLSSRGSAGVRAGANTPYAPRRGHQVVGGRCGWPNPNGGDGDVPAVRGGVRRGRAGGERQGQRAAGAGDGLGVAGQPSLVTGSPYRASAGQMGVRLQEHLDTVDVPHTGSSAAL